MGAYFDIVKRKNKGLAPQINLTKAITIKQKELVTLIF